MGKPGTGEIYAYVDAVEINRRPVSLGAICVTYWAGSVAADRAGHVQLGKARCLRQSREDTFTASNITWPLF
jgi:hypothetical protein